jgi:hypothetical protein
MCLQEGMRPYKVSLLKLVGKGLQPTVTHIESSDNEEEEAIETNKSKWHQDQPVEIKREQIQEAKDSQQEPARVYTREKRQPRQTSIAKYYLTIKNSRPKRNRSMTKKYENADLKQSILYCEACGRNAEKMGFNYSRNTLTCDSCRVLFRVVSKKKPEALCRLKCSRGSSNSCDFDRTCQKCRFDRMLNLGLRPLNKQRLKYVCEYMKWLKNRFNATRTEIKETSLNESSSYESQSESDSMKESITNDNNYIKLESSFDKTVKVTNCKVLLKDLFLE